ncbi:phosphate ABC transporter permease PstA [Elongatibacter sediminis]|uniref:Phosphate transport system permease protein PstA n=1 Tax=Elongatibacter sediminis TaxID=3119006 RepID=A0AAW9RHD3_9GAMM
MESPSRNWWRSGAPWISLHGTAVAACILLAGGLLALIMVRGLAFFWPTQVQEIIYLEPDGVESRIVGQIHGVEHVDSGRLADEGSDAGTVIERVLVKTGNRDIAGQDFRLLRGDRILRQSAPLSLVALERLEWGVFFGQVVGLRSYGSLLPSSDVWADFQSMIGRARYLREEARELERGPIADINYRLEQLRLEERERELDGDPDPVAAAAAASERRALQERYRGLESQLLAIEEQLNRDHVIVRISRDASNDREMPLRSIIDAWRPNDMSLLSRFGHFFRKFGSFITDEPREANTEGGIYPALFGTVLMVLLMTVFVAPLGVVAGVYLTEYARQGLLTRFVRISVNNLAGVPSIVYGVFGLGFFVYTVGGGIDRLFYEEALPSPTFGTGGLLWASLTLALLTLPVVIVTTEEGLARIPRSLREASLALGATRWETLWRTVLPMASPAIMTGLILSIARAAGEVAPLMLVGVVKLAPSVPLDGNFPYLHLERKFMHLGFHIYDVGFQSPNIEAARPLVYATAFLLVAVIVLLNLAAIHVRNNLRERFRGVEV